MTASILQEKSKTTTTCLYCFNHDHWVPAGLEQREKECRYCSDCRVYVPRSKWHEHEEDELQSEIIVCLACPLCGGIVPPDPRTAECIQCPRCDKFVPTEEAAAHQGGRCYDPEDPFAPL